MMLATDNIVKVVHMEIKAGYCYKCHRFRHCEHESERGQIVCARCIQILRNQGLLEIIPDRPEPKPTRQRNPDQKKPIAVKPPKEAKPSPENGYSIQKLLEESEKALTAKEIAALVVCGHKRSVHRILKRLIELGTVVASSETVRNRLFIDKNRVHLLQSRHTFKQGQYAKTSQTRILDYAKSKDRILEIADIVHGTNVTKKTAIRIVKFWGDAGDLTLTRSPKGNKLYFVPSDNAELVAKLTELEQSFTVNRVREILESSDGGVSIGDVMTAIGRGRRNGGSYVYIRKLFKEWGCKSYKQGCGLYYYLDKRKTHDQ